MTGPSIAEMAESSLLRRDVQPLEGTNMSLWNSVIPAWWTENGMNDLGKSFWPGNGLLAERVWIASRCLQMNSQQIASMPLRFEAPNVTDATEPMWVSNPDPLYYPNGVSDAVMALVHDIYGWGWGLGYITQRYANGYPRNWTVIPAARCEPLWDENGQREYKIGGTYLDPQDVIQIDRDPGCSSHGAAHGTSAIQAYAQLAWGLLAGGNQAMSVNTGGIPKVSLKVTDPNRKLTAQQAENLQTQWMLRTQSRDGAPPVLPYELDFKELSWSPKDMALLETQEFNALAIATAFGIPAILLNMTVGGGRGNSSLTYQNPAMLGEMWWRFELRPMAKRIADAFTAQALPAGQWVWFDAQDTFQPLNTPDAGPFATDEDDPQAAATAADSPGTPTPVEPSSASASPAQTSTQSPTRLVALGRN
ncbi:MAG: phage portal protein [Leifsonia sp.]